jgi:hypothetical protein
MGNCGSSAASDVDPAAKAGTRTAPPEKATKSSTGAKAKKIDPKVTAAIAVQKNFRAKAGRTKGATYMRERAERSCGCYRVNVKSDSFGICFCGWAKAEHGDDALRKGATNISGPKRVGSSEVRQRAHRNGEVESDRVAAFAPRRACPAPATAADLVRSRFICFPPPPSLLLQLRARMQKKDKVRCAKYVMNMEGENFGECVCGAPRDAHEDAALDKEKAKNDRKDSAEVRPARIATPHRPQRAAGQGGPGAV